MHTSKKTSNPIKSTTKKVPWTRMQGDWTGRCNPLGYHPGPLQRQCQHLQLTSVWPLVLLDQKGVMGLFNKPRFQICFPILESAYSSQTMPGPWLHSKYVCWMSWHSMGLAQFQTVKHIPILVTHVGRSVYWAPLPEGAEGIELDVHNDNAAVQERCDRGNDSGAAGLCQRCRGLAC